jgi:hypothetical protein
MYANKMKERSNKDQEWEESDNTEW